MLNALLSTTRRRQLGVCGALLAVAVLAACDKNEPTSPTVKPTTPSTSLTLTVEDSARIQKKWLPANELDTLLGGAARQ